MDQRTKTEYGIQSTEGILRYFYMVDMEAVLRRSTRSYTRQHQIGGWQGRRKGCSIERVLGPQRKPENHTMDRETKTEVKLPMESDVLERVASSPINSVGRPYGRVFYVLLDDLSRNQTIISSTFDRWMQNPYINPHQSKPSA